MPTGSRYVRSLGLSRAMFPIRLGQARHYFSDPDSYIGLDGCLGTAPDFDHQNIDYSYLKRLKSYGVRATYSQKFAKIWVATTKPKPKFAMKL